MNTQTQTRQTTQEQGCGGANCQCGGTAAAPESRDTEPSFTALQRPRAGAAAPNSSLPLMEPELQQLTPTATLTGIPSINGMALQAPDENLDPGELRERAFSELLRQECVARGLLPEVVAGVAPDLSEDEHQIIENLLEQVVTSPEPTAGECRRYFEAQSSRFVQGQAIHARHILFAVTPGLDVQALARRAEQALFELKKDEAGRAGFADMARELSNCPSALQGGDLGWIEPHACAPELAKVFFHQDTGMMPPGLQPRLIHSRFGLHIIEVLEHRAGVVPDFEQVKDRIAAQLQLQSRARALHQYIQLLAGRSRVEGLTLDAAASPLVQ